MSQEQMKQTSEKAAVKQAKAEVALVKRLLVLLDTPGVSWFFQPHPEQDWSDICALEAWEAWVKTQLSETELAIFKDRYEHEFGSMDEYRSGLLVENNRIPGPGNVDGY
ncbi:TPA: hypothetical protein L5732_005293 [Pseudomonas aeruginosa]|nr:hypothetical protein [Pseudomonas aeruginosa]